MPDYVNNPDKITYFAETDYRSKRVKFGIRDDDRARHMYIIGKTGMGKSTLLENLAIQDIQNGEGVCFIDPHGGTAETLLSYVPEHRIKDVIYFAPFDQEFPVGLNVMEDMGRDKRPLVASGLMGAFKKVWVDAWSARMEYILNNAMLALMETPGSTLLGVNRIFADKAYRNMIVANVTDPSVKAFWVDEYAKYSDKFATEATAAIQNKVGQFAANPLIRNMVGQPRSTFDIRDVMDTKKIFIVNLSKGRMGEGNANLVGSMLITKIYLAAMSRADVGADNVKGLPPFYLYVDEFQSFANESFADILSEARKYKLALTIAHQYIEQMSDEVRAAVFGNVGTMISFRVGSYDADVLEKEFAPVFLAEDMVNLGFAQVYMKLMIRGIGSPPFSATTLNRPKLPPVNYAQEVIEASRKNFARPRAEVEEEIRKWHEPIPEVPRDPNAPPPPPETRKYAPGTRPVRPPMGAVPQRVFTPSGAPRSYDAAPQQEVTRPRQSEQYDEAMQPQVVRQAPAPRPVMAVPQAPYVAAAPTIAPTDEVPAVEVAAPVHQPFKEIFTKVAEPIAQTVDVPKKEIFVPTPPPRAVEKGERAERPSRSPQQQPRQPQAATPASLTALKSQPKKDKGPSEGNMTSLKAALESVMMNARNNERMRAAQESTKTATPQQAQKTEARTEPQQPVPAPLVREQTPPPAKPSLLDEHPQMSSVREVPEDVLRSVLAD